MMILIKWVVEGGLSGETCTGGGSRRVEEGAGQGVPSAGVQPWPDPTEFRSVDGTTAFPWLNASGGYFCAMSVRYWLKAASLLGREVNSSVPIPWRRGQPGVVSCQYTWQLGNNALAQKPGLDRGPTASTTYIMEVFVLFKWGWQDLGGQGGKLRLLIHRRSKWEWGAWALKKPTYI